MPTKTSRRPSAAADSQFHTPTATLGELRASRRRICLARIGVWLALATGPLALAAWCMLPRGAAALAQPKAAPPTAMRTADPAGVAVLFIDLWLRSDAASPDSPDAQTLHALAPSVDLPTRADGAAQTVPERILALRSAQLSGDSWSVIVAVTFTVRDSGSGSGMTAGGRQTVVRYSAVPVVAHDDAGAGSFTVTSAPAEVAGPATARPPASPFQNPIASDSVLASAVNEFLNAYLAGVGDVTRYLSPGTQLAAVNGSGYQSVAVDSAAADSDAAGGPVPGDGTRVRVQVHAIAKDAAGSQWPLVYVLTMTARSGRWEVTALEAGAPQQGRSRVPPARPAVSSGPVGGE